jgi:cation:H+ antiporter
MNGFTENLIAQSFVLLISLAGLILFSDKLIDASAKLAKAFGLSDVVIGLTLLAYGTSLPELTVSTISAVESYPDLSIANVIGSNIFNITFIVGTAVFIKPFTLSKNHLSGRDNYIMVGTTFMFVAVLSFFGGINRVLGFMMILLVISYTYYILNTERTDNRHRRDLSVSKLREAVIVLVCFLFVIISGEFAVDSAVAVAYGLEVSKWVIGATIIAVGTSLPELALSIIAAKKGFFGMSLGNIVGSNILNILWILGFTAAIAPLSVEFDLIFWDCMLLITATSLLAFHLIRKKISRIESIPYMILYIGYILYLLY